MAVLREGEQAYGLLAEVYDALMESIPYDYWIEYVVSLAERLRIPFRTVADLACGTGNTTFPWARRGYPVIGVDASESMLAVARRKARVVGGAPVLLLRQDLRRLALPQPVDLAVCLYDSLNYLTDLGDLRRAFRAVAANLSPGGHFIFDMNSEHRLLTGEEEVYHFVCGEHHVIWEHASDPSERVWRVHLTGFLRRDHGEEEPCYRRFEEWHVERAYPVETVLEALEWAGFAPLQAFHAYTFHPPREDSERILFVARARGG